MISVSYTEWNCKAKLNQAPNKPLGFSHYSYLTAVSNFDPESMTSVTSPNLTVGGTNTNKRGSGMIAKLIL